MNAPQINEKLHNCLKVFHLWFIYWIGCLENFSAQVCICTAQYCFQNCLNELSDKEKDIEAIEKLANELQEKTGLNPDKLKITVNSLKQKHYSLKIVFSEKKEKLREYIVYIEEYYIIIEEITEYIIVTKKNAAFTEPISSEPAIIKRQLKDIEVRSYFI